MATGMNGLWVLLMAAGLATAITRASSQEIGQANRGLALAQQLCAQCHAVHKDTATSPNPDAPRFQVIASVPGMTSIALTAALNNPHRSMPNILLEPGEQADIIAYILSIK
jgi:mono/diheme cytochrome c family protein